MITSRKIFMGITGVALIFLGFTCIMQPIATLATFAWILGLIVLISGISTLLNWFSMKRYFLQSGSILFSAIIQIIIGIIFLNHGEGLMTLMSYIFSFYLLIEGINLAFRSFDYKKVGYKGWMVNFILGIVTAILGLLSLKTPIAGGAAIGALIGIGFISAGVVYISALVAVNRFGKVLNKNPWVDEQ